MIAKRVCLLVASLCMGTAFVGCQENDHRQWDEFWDLNKPGSSNSGDRRSGFVAGKQVGEDEEWTIECNSYEGEGAAELSGKMASALKEVAKLRADQVWTQHEGLRSRVYYGTYSLRYVEARADSKSHARGDVIIELSEDLRRDLRFIRTLAMGDEYPFFSARPLPKPIEGDGPPDWDLAGIKNGVYSLHVGVTYNTPTLHNYKQAAIEWVRALRQDGYEAYYYHDPDQPRSSICVGIFGPEAMVDEGQGRQRYSDAVNALRGRGDFMYNLENGHRSFRLAKNPENGKTERIANWSFLVKVPSTETAVPVQMH